LTPSPRRLGFEPLEDRRLLSIGAEFVTLPGMRLVDPRLDRFDGQVVYLDFDGAENVTYSGPVTVRNISVPAFSTEPLGLAGFEEESADLITQRVAEMLGPLGVQVTDEVPDAEEYAIIYIGGTDDAFSAYGSFFGLAEAVDVGNVDCPDIGFVFSEELAIADPSSAQYSWAIATIVTHEAGHLLGFAHDSDLLHKPRVCSNAVSDRVLDKVTYTVDTGKEVHQWIAKEATALVSEQFPGVEIAQPLYRGTIEASTLIPGSDSTLLEGAFDEDVDLLVHGAIENPFGQWEPFLRHFCAGGDGDEIYNGWLGYDSALEQAEAYWQTYVIDNYLSSRSLSYYYLGHVVHLLQDMSVPAHVHNDQHGIGDDEYEDWVGENSHFQNYDTADVASSWNIYLPTGLEAVFRLTADYTEDYPSDDYWGEDPTEYGASYRAPNRHRPGEITSPGELTPGECETIADDLMPWAMEQVGALFRLFYSEVDDSPPVVSLNGISRDFHEPTVFNSPYIHVSGSASDPQSGIDIDGYHYVTMRWNGFDWVDRIDHGAGLSTRDDVGPFDEGSVYSISLTAENGAGTVWGGSFSDPSAIGYFRVIGAPTLLSPGTLSDPGPTISSTTPEFTWTDGLGADYYGLYIRDLDADVLVFDSEIDYGPLHGTSFALPSGILQDAGRYRWNMRAHCSSGWTDFSERLYFRVEVSAQPALSLSVSPGSFSEAAGGNAATGRVTRDGSTASALVVSLSSGDTSEVAVPATATISVGQAWAEFPVNAVDDVIVDGTQTVTITASATGYLAATRIVQVTDNEQPSLRLAVTPSTFAENSGSNAATARVTRDGLTGSALTVNLGSSDTTEATVQPTVTIALGEAWAEFPVNAVDDAIVDGTQTVTITATASGYISGSYHVEVTDNDVPPDTTPPSIPTVTGMEADTGESNTDWLTNDATPTFSWTASSDDGSGVRGYWWSVDNTPPQTVGTFTTSLSAPTSVSPGIHTFYVRAEDNAGNFSNVSAQAFQVDTESPTVDYTNPQTHGTAVSPGPREIRVRFSEAMDQVSANSLLPNYLSLSGAGVGSAWVTGATWLAPETARFTISGTWETGQVTVQLASGWPRDRAGNPVASYTGDFIVQPGVSSLSGTVFEDRNRNGIWEPGEPELEPGLQGWTVELRRIPDPVHTFLGSGYVAKFGYSVAAAGNNVLIGAPWDDTIAVNAGNAYLFDGLTGNLLQTFPNPANPTHPRLAAGDDFGRSVAGVGNNVLVGAPFDDAVVADSGAAYLFDWSTGNLLLTFPDPANPTHPTLAAQDRFGYSVAAVGNNVLVGAPYDDTGGTDAGAAFLFDGSTGSLLRKFQKPTPAAYDHFGWSVTAVGDNVLIGAPWDGTGGTNAGAAYLFEFNDLTNDWELRCTFQKPTPARFDEFGGCVSAMGNNVLLAALYDDTAGRDAGAVYLFGLDGSSGDWELRQTFLNPTPAANDFFGVSIAAVGPNVVVGAPYDDTVAVDAGAAYLFDGATGELLETFFKTSLTPGPQEGDQFGQSVAAVGNRILVGAESDDMGVRNGGGAYSFEAVASEPSATGTFTDGYYTFAGLEAGIYQIGEMLRDGYVRTFPEDPGVHTSIIGPDENLSGLDFGNYQTIAARHIFYNNSAFDGGNPAGNDDDDDAIATDKTPLLPGETAGVANYTNYSRGINGIIIDIAGLAGTPIFDDFEFKFGNDDNPDGWTSAATPNINVRPGDGRNGSDRVTLTWPDNAIRTRNWLQVRARATANTGLAQDDVFYFGNAIGNVDGNGVADEADMQAIYGQIPQAATIENPLDIDRDGAVAYADMYVTYLQIGQLPVLNLITLPSVVATDDAAATDEDAAADIAVLANDRDVDGNPLSVAGADTTSTLGASITVNPDGTLRYDPRDSAALQALAAGESMEDTFSYTISDLRGGTDTASVTVTVSGVDEPQGIRSAESFGVGAPGGPVPLAMSFSTGGENGAGTDRSSASGSILEGDAAVDRSSGTSLWPHGTDWIRAQAVASLPVARQPIKVLNGNGDRVPQPLDPTFFDRGPAPLAMGWKAVENAAEVNRASAHDAFMGEVTGWERLESALDKWDWLWWYDLQQMRMKKRSSEKDNRVEPAADQLLASYWP